MKAGTEQKKIRYEAGPKPELDDVKEIMPDTQEFTEPNKAKAIIGHLSLQVGDTIRESDDGEYYTINPRMVLEGDMPEHYKTTIDNLKKILTKDEIRSISQAISRNTKDYNKKLYDRITKRTDKFYYRQEIKKSLPQEIKEVLEFFKNNNHTGINNTIYHLLSKDKQDFVICYKCAWGNRPVPNIQEWEEKDDGEYRVLTDSEAETACDDYLIDDDSNWKESVKAGQTTDSLEDWANTVKNCDGRGSILNSYDGCEESETVEGIEYYIYRTN